MSRAIIVLVVIGILLYYLTGCAPTPNALKIAFNQQNYHTVFVGSLENAKIGDAGAEYTLGYLYYYGLGTPKNIPLAKKYLGQAAKQHHPKAIEALKRLQSKDESFLLNT